MTPGPTFTPGDGTVSIDTRGNLVIGGASDAGTGSSGNPNGSPYTVLNPDGTTTLMSQRGTTDFTLWTPATAIDLYSAGGDVAPLAGLGNTTENSQGYYPGTLIVAAANGDIRFNGPGEHYQHSEPGSGIDAISERPARASGIGFDLRSDSDGSDVGRRP